MPVLGLNLRGKLVSGFAALIAISAASAAISFWKSRDIAASVQNVADVRAPAALLGARLVAAVNQARIIVNDQLIDPRDQNFFFWEQAWTQITESRDAMDRFAAAFPSQQDRERWAEVRATFDEMKAAQRRVLNLVGTPEQFPALSAYENDIVPRLAPLEQALATLVSREIDKGADASEQVMTILVALQARTLSAVRDLGAYVHAGNPRDKANFEQTWARAQERLGDLAIFGGTLNAEQNLALDKVRAAVSAIRFGATDVVELRGDAGWNAPLALMRSEVTPLTERIMTALEGAADANGKRSGGPDRRADWPAQRGHAQCRRPGVAAVHDADGRRRPVAALGPRHRPDAGPHDRDAHRRHDPRDAEALGGASSTPRSPAGSAPTRSAPWQAL
jgi:methyl-accepting chemotaxis protein